MLDYEKRVHEVASWIYTEWAVNGADGQYLPDEAQSHHDALREAASRIYKLESALRSCRAAVVNGAVNEFACSLINREIGEVLDD